jgi:tol-pal system protein YbgF
MGGLRLGLMAAAAGLVLVAAPMAFSQTPMEDPLDARDAKRVDRMEKVVRELRDIVFKAQRTGAPVVVQPADTDARMADLANRLGDLEQSLTRLNGSIEAATHEADVAKRENAALSAQVKALTDRLAAAEQKAAEAATVAAPAPSGEEPPPPPAGPDQKAAAADAFAQARQLMLSGDYDGAETAFSGFVSAYPDDAKTPEARYWWGKTLSVRGAHANAASAYIGAIRGWPKTGWAPDAVGELARSLLALKKPDDACAALSELGKRYPKAPAAVTTRAAATARQAKCAS